MKIINKMNLSNKSKLLECEIEAFSFDDDSYSVWHCRFKNGEELVNEDFDIDDVKEVKFDEEAYEFDCSKAFALGSKDEGIKKYEPVAKEGDELIEESDLSNFVIENETLKCYKGSAGICSLLFRTMTIPLILCREWYIPCSFRNYTGRQDSLVGNCRWM